jgi:phosphoribosylglycinamide formyltransferase-1
MKTAVLISGRGTNLEAILHAEENNNLGKAKVVLVVSNNSDALGLNIAKKYSKRTAIIEKEAGEKLLLDLLQEHKIELIVLAGFMQILSPSFISKYVDRILNIHPSLLPSFPGLKAQRQALEAGVKVSGCTVHFVNEEVDGGPIILQKAVKIKDNDTVEELASRILEIEHKILPQAISLFSEGKLEVDGKTVRIVN